MNTDRSTEQQTDDDRQTASQSGSRPSKEGFVNDWTYGWLNLLHEWLYKWLSLEPWKCGDYSGYLAHYTCTHNNTNDDVYGKCAMCMCVCVPLVVAVKKALNLITSIIFITRRI